jgi:Arc/MetJ-type ribon-helix-helix transcriptional regulator
MEITVTKPIEEFIKEQVAKGYADESEVARQAFLRWMADEEFDSEPPRLREKIEAARQGRFRPYDPDSYDALIGADETPDKLRLLRVLHGSRDLQAELGR